MKALLARVRRISWTGLLRRILVACAVVLIVVPVGGVLAFRAMPVIPPGMLVFERLFEGKGYARHWRRLDEISPNLVYAVIAAEDAKFCTHHGFDGQAIEKALSISRMS